MTSWFTNRQQPLAKSQYYVWFLGSKESDGLRGGEYVVPVMRQLLSDSLQRFPSKLTVQVSEKGLKLIQSITTVNKAGKLKMDVVKFLIPAHSLSFSMIGPPPYCDVLGCIFLVFNPETRRPLHIHCFRCDSPETAAIFHANLQSIIQRPDNQRRFNELERRLVITGASPPAPPLARRRSPSAGCDDRNVIMNPLDSLPKTPTSDHSLPTSDEYMGITSDESDKEPDEEEETSGTSDDSDRKARLHRALFAELKEKLRSKLPIYVPPKDYPLGSVKKRPVGRKPAKTDDDMGVHNQNNTSSSGLGSDLSSSAGRFRYSIADTSRINLDWETSEGPTFLPDPTRPSQTGRLDSLLKYRETCVSAEHLYQKPTELQSGGPTADSSKMLRLFGDTFRFAKKPAKPCPKIVPDPPVVARPAPVPAPRFSKLREQQLAAIRRSMDNLHHIDHGTGVPDICREPPNVCGARKIADRFPSSANFEQDRKTKLDNFWRERARRPLWHSPPSARLY